MDKKAEDETEKHPQACGIYRENDPWGGSGAEQQLNESPSAQSLKCAAVKK